MRAGLHLRIGVPRAAFADPDVRRVAGLMLPAIFSVSVAQLSHHHQHQHRVAPDDRQRDLAGLRRSPDGVSDGAARRGARHRAAAEPVGRVRRKRTDDYSKLLDWGLRLIFLLALPAALGLGLLAEGIVSVLFQGREFTAHDVRMTSVAVVGYAVGLIGLIAVKILAPGFYAQKDIRTPVKIAVAVLIATQLANLVLVPLLAHAGLALSVSLGACANALALYRRA